MCGIVGVIEKGNFGFTSSSVNSFKDMLIIDSYRGMDSTGVFLVNVDGNVNWSKNTDHGWNFVYYSENEKELDPLIWSPAKENGKILVGHNRKATSGEVTDENAHPFIQDNIIVVHNGSVRGHKKFADTEVDSHSLAYLFSSKPLEEAIPLLDGAFALAWYDINKKEFYLLRNNERPLFVVETQSYWYFGSELNNIKLALERNHKGSQIVNEGPLPSGELWTFDLDNTKEPKKSKVEFYKNYYTTSTYYPTKSSSSCSVTTLPKFIHSTGDTVLFKITKITNWQHVNTAPIPGEAVQIDGHVLGDTTITVRGQVNGGLWEHIEDQDFVAAEVSSVNQGAWINGVQNKEQIWIVGSSLRNGFSIKTKNNVVVNNVIWSNMPHVCHQCKSVIAVYELEECKAFVPKKPNKKSSIWCPVCTEKSDSKKSQNKVLSLVNKISNNVLH